MTTKKKLFIGAVVLELAVAGWIGYRIATARERPWDVQSLRRPKTKPKPKPRT